MTAPVERGPIRESGIAVGLGWFLAAWGWMFVVDLVGRADVVTSPQWRYLMSVPGGQWAWIAVFGSASIILTLGLIVTNYLWRATGLAVMGAGSLGIAGFYLCAPLIDPGLTTLGWHPWWGWAVLMLLGAVVNWRPTPWF